MILDVLGHPVHLHGDGHPLAPSLPAIVLLHGALNDHTVWRAQLPALAATGAAILAPDLPAHGRSGGPALATIEGLADWLAALLDAAGVGRALLAGHSMGSLVALECAHRHPGRVSGIALLGTAAPMRVSSALMAQARDDEAAAIDMVAAWSHARTDAAPSDNALALRDTTRALMRRVAQAGPAHLLHTDLNACAAYANGAVAAAGVACPALFVLGSRDVMTPPRAAATLLQAMPHAHAVTVDAGHAMMAEQPDAVGAALADFARTLNSTTLAAPSPCATDA